MAGIQFYSMEKKDFLKSINEDPSTAPASYFSDDFMKSLDTGADSDKWSLHTFTYFDGIAGYFGAIPYVYNYLVRWNPKTQKVDFVVYAGMLPNADESLFYSFEGDAEVSTLGKVYENTQILQGKYKPYNMPMEDAKSWFDIMQLVTMHILDDVLSGRTPPSMPATPAKFLRKAMRAEE